MGFFERFFARKKSPESDPAHSPYILPGEMGYPGDRAPGATATMTATRPTVGAPPPPPPPPPAATAPETMDPPVAPRPTVSEDRPRAVAHEPAIEHAEEHGLHDFDPPQGKPGAAWVILEDGTVAYLPGDAELKERMRYLADNLLPPAGEDAP
jgi:hypothetical protein